MKKHVLTIAAITIAVAALTMSWVGNSGQKKMAYFDYNKVYNECELKIQLEKDLEKVVSLRKSELDSMQIELSLLSTKVQAENVSDDVLNDFEDRKNRYLTFKNQYEQENIRLKEQYFTQIRTMINEKSKKYAEDNGYDYLLAAVGDGSLMYASDSEDITSDFMIYVNQK